MQRPRHERLNVAIASAVTSNARLRLLDAMHALGDRFIYADTDSVSYISKLGEPSVFTGEGTLVEGSLLGEWEQEKESDETIVCAKKSYCHSLKNEVVKHRAKGITLTYHNSQVLSQDSMREQLFGFVAGCPPVPIETRKRLFERITDDGNYHLRIRVAAKFFQPVLDTRCFPHIGSFMTYPRCHPELGKCM